MKESLDSALDIALLVVMYVVAIIFIVIVINDLNDLKNCYDTQDKTTVVADAYTTEVKHDLYVSDIVLMLCISDRYQEDATLRFFNTDTKVDLNDNFRENRRSIINRLWQTVLRSNYNAKINKPEIKNEGGVQYWNVTLK